ncbi:hypothetical protein BGW36DRAFT_33749 [Talaromyces proteolyticus]|uniref:DUF2293 domain-containing protein n=1 Tax=Talaromyces proteolyticus TaxID=1131652 RepID=A0AAD4KQA4_9EURO|nr:uncharacterized protein BGW36DRAFT_33749 [Talaromyces proteolyticus]KAH8693084.1 hypothetical protein BGW36DRAFT_33749 [Talaromyces proteolyticus]
MARLQRRPGATRAQNGLARAKFRKHKVIMESITQKKKKLRSIVYFEAEAPAGYTFIPAGNPRFTTVCKEVCRKQGLKVFAVTTTPHQKTHGLSQQVHRVGYHFPSTVVARACMELGVYLTENGTVLSIEQFNTNIANERNGTEISQVTINTEARDVIRDLFPNIPDDDVNQIIKTAFQKGQQKVGTAVELPLARRAQLAVVAHIRHLYTDYDRLLKKTSFQEARRNVEESTLEKLVQWRGEDDNGVPELEDVFREVIVISDDEDEDDEDEGHPTRDEESNTINHDSSVEILSSNVVTDRVDVEDEQENNQAADFTRGFRLVHKGPSQETNKSKIDRRGFSRYQAWDRAIGRYRERRSFQDRERGYFHNREISDKNNNHPQWISEAIVNERPNHQPITVGSNLGLQLQSTSRTESPRNGDKLYTENHSLQHNDDRPYPSVSRRNAPDILHFPDGSIFSKIPSSTPEGRPQPSADIPVAPVFVAGPSTAFGLHYENPRKRIHPSGILATNYDGGDLLPHEQTIFPSIEGSDLSAIEKSLARNRAYDSYSLHRTVHRDAIAQLDRPIEDLSRKIDVINLTDEGKDYPKRRRLQLEQISSDLRRPVSCENIALHRLGDKRLPIIPPLTARNRHIGQALDNRDVYRMPIASRDSNFLMEEHLEQPIHTITRPEASLEKSSMKAGLAPTGDYIRDDHRYTVDPYLDTLKQSKGPMLSNENYLVELPRNKVTQKPYIAGHPHFSYRPDNSGWRSKANDYEYQRGIIDAEDYTRPSSAHGPQQHVGLLQPGERHEPDHPNARLDPRAASWGSRSSVPQYSPAPSSHKLHGFRASSRGSPSATQKKKDGLPVSAIRRYEVQLEKSMNP